MRRSILTKFILRSILVLAVSILIVEGASYRSMSASIRELTSEKADQQANQFAEQINNKLVTLEADIALLQNLDSVAEYFLNINYGLIPEANRVLEHSKSLIKQLQKRMPEYENVVICDLVGQPLSQNIYPKQLKDLQIFQHCQSALKTNEFNVIEPPKNGGAWYVVVRRPVVRQNQPLGFIEISMNLDRIINEVESTKIFENGFYTLFSNQLKRPVHSALHQDHLAISQQDDMLEKGVQMSLSKAQIEPIDWSITGHIYEDEMFADLNKTIFNAIITVFFVLLFEMLILFGFVREIVILPLKKLIDGAKKFNEGNLGYRIEHIGNDEIGTLSLAFNRMGAYVESKINTLNQQASELEHSESRLKYILNNTSAIVCIKKRSGEYSFVNQAYQQLVGLTPESIIGKSDVELFNKEVAASYKVNDQRVIESKQVIRFEEHAINVHGEIEYHISVKIPLFDLNGEVYAVCNIATDITDMKVAEDALKASHQQLRLIATIFETSREGFVITDANFIIVDINTAITRLFGYEKKELIGKSPSIFYSGAHDDEFYTAMNSKLKEEGFWHGEVWERHKNGDIFPQMLSISSVVDEEGEITHYATIRSDISELKTTQAKLERLAHFDPLTGLANRLLLHERVVQNIKSAARNSEQFALMFIDLDNFKYINDSLGHKTGDELLKTLAARISGLIREKDTVGRLGGDEFVLILTDVKDKEHIVKFVAKLQNLLCEVFPIDGNQLYVTSSIGISLFPDDGASYDELLQTADTAMYEAKNKGKNTFQFYSSVLNLAAKERLLYESKLRTALEHDEFFVVYQPIVDIDTNRVVKAEALLRWKTRDGEVVSPMSFIPILEDIGLIAPIGDWIVEQVARDIHYMDKCVDTPSLMDIKLNINLSPVQFRNEELASELGAIVASQHIEPSRLEFEVTESALMDDYQLAQNIVGSLKEQGFTIALDDFGTGFSSLSYLKYFPFDSLKLDRAFIKDIETNVVDATIVESVIEMAQALDLFVVCEGIETNSQLDYLRKYKAILVQGYFYSKPLERDEFIEFIHNF
jgi:diguanylate cyclase (GGDEF)-like protein/PAS domain S-box-containing protein